MIDPTPTARSRQPEPAAVPALELTGPGVCPLETRECPQLHTDGVGPAPNRARIHSSDSIGVVCSVSEGDTLSSRVPLRYGEGPEGVALALRDFPGAALHPSVKQWCPDCPGTGRVPDENGPKVEVFYDLHDSAFRWKPADEGPLSSRISDTFPTAAEAFAAAQRAHEEGKR